LNNKGQLTATASPAQPRRPEILRLATATAFYGGGYFLRLATAYELYGGLRRRLGGLSLTLPACCIILLIVVIRMCSTSVHCSAF